MFYTLVEPVFVSCALNCLLHFGRAHVHKGSTLRGGVVKGARQRKRASIEHTDKSRKRPKGDLQQHLQQFFHHYCQEEKESNDEEAKEYKNV